MKKILLCVLDGLGESKIKKGNAVYDANTPNLDYLTKKYGKYLIEASGKYVGLPEGQMGNSEVGHLNIGAGRVVYQPLELINKAIEDKTFYSNKSIVNAISHAKDNNSKLHIMGLLSDGGVHSDIKHFKELLKICSDNNFNNVHFHVFTDGRDTYPDSSKKYLSDLQEEIDKYNVGKISSISGRYYAMDRDKRWDRVQKAYNSLVYKSDKVYLSYNEIIDENYKNDITDEFILPSVIESNGIIEENDAIIWVNFRPDRAIEILSALTDPNFSEFDTKKFSNLYLTTVMYVSENITSDIAFKMDELNNTLGVYLSNLGIKQLRIAETEKYAHVTYFFDGGKDLKLEKCRRILVPSPKVTTYDLAPEMSAKKITRKLLWQMRKSYNFIFVNFANPDMVGHTGDYKATIKAVETVDECLGKIYKKCLKKDYLLIVTADHGNAEYMLDENDNVVTSHTANKVPFIVCDNVKCDVKKLSDIAPFVLKCMNLKIPNEMK